MEPLLNSSNLESSTTQKLSFFQIFFQKASRSEKKIIIFICLIFSMSSAMILGIPIVFQDPKIICTSTNEECSEEIACTEDYSIDLVTGPNSFSAEFGLICEKKSEKTLAITLGFVGVFIGCLMSTFILVSPQKRKSCLSFFGILLGASLLGMIVAEESFFIISLLVGLASFCFMFINTFAYLFIGENFEGELAGFVTIIYSVTWAFTGVFYSIFAYSINANWRIFVVLTGALSLFAGFGLLILKNEKDYESEKNEKEEVTILLIFI